MPEMLSRKGFSWKVYNEPVSGKLDNVLTSFNHLQRSVTGHRYRAAFPRQPKATRRASGIV